MKMTMRKNIKSIISVIITVITIMSSFTVCSFGEETTVTDSSDYKSIEDFALIDFNDDGVFNLKEIRILLRITAKLEQVPYGYNELEFDADKNSKFTASDVRIILRLYAKLPAVEPTTVTTTKAAETTSKQVTTTKKATATTKTASTTLAQKMTPKYSTSGVSVRFNESVVYDLTNDQMLYGYNMKAKAYPASTTKIITAYIASLYVPMNTMCNVGTELNLMESNSSTAGIRQGYRMTMQDLITCLLLPSGCDAAYTIAAVTARYITKKSMTDREAVNYFVNLMNTTAKKLGCVNSHFVNPSGFPNSNHYTCAYDLCLFAKAFNANKTLKLIASWHYKNLKIASGQTLYLENTNYLINSTSRYYYKYAYGIKTGSHSLAGKCLVSAAKKNNRELLVIILGGSDQTGRYSSAINYFEHFFNMK